MCQQRLCDDDSRWRAWSRIPPGPDSDKVDIQTAGGQELRADIINMSVEGMAVLLRDAGSVRAGDMWRLRVNEETAQAVVAHIQQHGMFYRIGVTYVS